MKCDHGIALDRYCGDCETTFDAWVEEWHAATRRRSGLIAAAALLVVFALVALAWWTR